MFESDFWLSKPSSYKIIWLYILGKVNHKQNGRFGRGEGFFVFERDKYLIGNDITSDKIKKFLKLARNCNMISTKRSTRGTTLKVLNYGHFQKIDNYTGTSLGTTKSTSQALQRHDRGTPIHKNERMKELKNKDIYVAFEQATLATWNSFCDSFPVLSKVISVSGKRRTSLKQRFECKHYRDNIVQAIKMIGNSNFLRGRNDREWKVSFDWLILNDTNYLKVLEGKYKNKVTSEIDKILKGVS